MPLLVPLLLVVAAASTAVASAASAAAAAAVANIPAGAQLPRNTSTLSLSRFPPASPYTALLASSCLPRNIKSQNFLKNSIRVFDEPGLAKLWEYMDGIKNDITREEQEVVAAAAASAAATAAVAASAVTPGAEGSSEKPPRKSSAGKPKKGARKTNRHASEVSHQTKRKSRGVHRAEYS